VTLPGVMMARLPEALVWRVTTSRAGSMTMAIRR
jgi:hypothetical protein